MSKGSDKFWRCLCRRPSFSLPVRIRSSPPWATGDGHQEGATRKPHPINPKSHNHSVTISWQVFSDRLWYCFVEFVPVMESISWKLPGIGIHCRVQQWQTHTQLCICGPKLLQAVFSGRQTLGRCFGDVHHCYSIEREEAVLWQLPCKKLYIHTDCDLFYRGTDSVAHSFNVLSLTFHIHDFQVLCRQVKPNCSDFHGSIHIYRKSS